jgi:hypothetical protein
VLSLRNTTFHDVADNQSLRANLNIYKIAIFLLSKRHPTHHSKLSVKEFWDFSCLFQFFFLSLRHRLLVHLWAAGGLIYEKDVFERLSLWSKNFATSKTYSWQMTTRRLRGAFLYTLIIYSTCWRGLTALSILCRWAMRRPLDPGWAEKQTPTPFLYI